MTPEADARLSAMQEQLRNAWPAATEIWITATAMAIDHALAEARAAVAEGKDPIAALEELKRTEG